MSLWLRRNSYHMLKVKFAVLFDDRISQLDTYTKRFKGRGLFVPLFLYVLENQLFDNEIKRIFTSIEFKFRLIDRHM